LTLRAQAIATVLSDQVVNPLRRRDSNEKLRYGRGRSGAAMASVLTDGTAERSRQERQNSEPKRRLCVNNKLSCALALFICVTGLATGPAIKNTFAQTATTSQSGIDQNIQLLRQDIRSKKKQLVAANLNLTETEATKFWPVYDQYTADFTKISDQRVALIKEYADSWGKMSDDQALSLTNRALAVEKNTSDLRIRYVPTFKKVIPGTKVATFFQLDRRIQTLIDVQLSSQLPLVQDQQ